MNLEAYVATVDSKQYGVYSITIYQYSRLNRFIALYYYIYWIVGDLSMTIHTQKETVLYMISAVSEILKPGCLAVTAMSDHCGHIFHRYDLLWTLSEAQPVSTWFYALCCGQIILLYYIIF